MKRLLVVAIILAVGAGLAYGAAPQNGNSRCGMSCCYQYHCGPCLTWNWCISPRPCGPWGYWNWWMWSRPCNPCWPPQCPDDGDPGDSGDGDNDGDDDGDGGTDVVTGDPIT